MCERDICRKHQRAADLLSGLRGKGCAFALFHLLDARTRTDQRTIVAHRRIAR
jgi:hypothetical protein